MEAFLRTTTDAPRLVLPHYEGGTDALPHHVKARRARTGKMKRQRKESSGGFRGACWGCGRKCSWAEQWSEASAGGCAAPPGISCRLTTAPTAVRVAGTVNGLSVQLVADTDSEKTLVGEDLVDVSSVPETTQHLCGITGQRVVTWGPVMYREISGNATIPM
ncbi:hypothetical protein E2C01_054054 [Portunus trituberculatus]|uniref:Uncharacterized protein n=1 Tax=Portunus trituberculatus TaxID=210409 RepID=A0A5B7GR04_PORTR|nr:hypothetical protein [Portunus trituberculatus]